MSTEARAPGEDVEGPASELNDIADGVVNGSYGGDAANYAAATLRACATLLRDLSRKLEEARDLLAGESESVDVLEARVAELEAENARLRKAPEMGYEVWRNRVADKQNATVERRCRTFVTPRGETAFYCGLQVGHHGPHERPAPERLP